MEIISSNTNNLVQNIKSLKDKKSRHDKGLFIIEGENIIKDFSKEIDLVYLVVSVSKIDAFEYLINKYKSKVIVVEDKVMKVLSDTVTPCGILAVLKIPKANQNLNGNVVVLDGISDPGNMGTIIRSCTACGVRDIICIDCVDYTSGKVVRSSMGGVLKCNLIACNHDKALKLLKDKTLYALDMSGENLYTTKFNKVENFALLVGSEAHGVSAIMRNRANKILSIPMCKGSIESLNAGVSLSIALFQLVNSEN